MSTVDALAFYHDPVMLAECLDGLNIKADGTYADCTLGGGGHSCAIANKLSESGTLHAFDRDEEAVAYATRRLAGTKPKFIVHPVRFGELKNEIAPATLDGILYDLGISSHQVDDRSRGFTFVGNNPLDLRMDRREGVSAQQWLMSVSADDLAEALRKNADMDRAFKLATRLVEMAAAIKEEGREILPSDVQAAVEAVFPDKRREINGLLARVFQAVRMEVNGELKEIEDSMRAAVDCLKVGGRLVVMSYHSVEDRCVKQTAAEFEKACICPDHMPVCTCGGNHQRLKKVNRKPILPSDEEIAKNSRARSAKLRVYERV
ncbi:16S rRNA (cytosine(1402)-N(4))-methyltransferase RsmH [Fibrobacter sp. UBA4309]|uniref:16S rRNA (cytosine(1402)-N(4))-methyltransferase RsmH n=1 Tax=Fibrobacter sp. UBA4309 TaxID=1946537 RepID=UPI0025BE9A16|nr:16S rRNA (cytosine(1402)-N(4))-methyltransferase RsmH [Fibrobacter sp. UBA4309]